MKAPQKGFANLIIIAIVAILVGLGGYFVLRQKVILPAPTPILNPAPNPTSTPNPTSSPTTPPKQPAKQNNQNISGGVLEAEYKVLFVDKITGKSEPIESYPFVVSFGPECHPYDMARGSEVPPNLVGLCEWRRKLATQTVSVKTNSSGVANIKVSISPAPSNITDPLDESLLAEAVTPGFDKYKEPAEVGWVPLKFEIKFDVRKDSQTHWSITVEYVGFRGDTPASFRNK